VCINYLGGYRNSMTFVLAGLDIEEKARVAEETFWHLVGGRARFTEATVQLRRPDRADPASNDEAFAYLQITVKDADADRVGRAFSNKVIEMALASYPGFFVTTPPGDAAPFGVYWPTMVPSDLIEHRVIFEGDEVVVPPVLPPPGPHDAGVSAPALPAPPGGPTARVPLGVVCGARSGDKGGNANIGVWVTNPNAYAWLAEYLTVECFKRLIPEAQPLVVERFPLPNLLSINFVVNGLLGDGVAASTRSDPQAKSLGEYLRARLVDVPQRLLAQ
jgi:hypothetical protein